MAAVPKTITTTPTLLAEAKGPGQRQWVRVELLRAESQDAYLGMGDAAVTTSTGHKLTRGFATYIENDSLAKPAANAIYGIVASGSVAVLVDEGS